MTNKEKFLNLVSNEPSDTANRISERIRNRAMLRESQDIALKVLMKLDEMGWNQRRLAKEMGVSPQQVNKIVSGKENLTLETLVRLQQFLDIPILASQYEKKAEAFAEYIGKLVRNEYSYPLSKPSPVIYDASVSICKVIRITSRSYTDQIAANG